MAALLEAQNITVQVGHKTLVHAVDLNAESGQILALVGPNGAGKTTLLKALLGLIPHQGRVLIAGHLLSGMSGMERARQVAYVPQFTMLTARLTGRDVVAQGRFAHRGMTTTSAEIIEQALADTDCLDLADRPFAVCSGGERSRLLLARALATEAPLLLLDEPTAALDLAHALHLYGLLSRLAKSGKGIVLVQHQLADALRWADQTFVMQGGQRVASGPTEAVLTADLVEKVFGLRMYRNGITFDLAGANYAH